MPSYDPDPFVYLRRQALASGTVQDGTPAAPSLGTLTLSGILTNGTSSNGTITGATSGSTIVGNVTGLSVNSLARTYTFDGTAAAGTTTNGLVEMLVGATGSPMSSPVTVQSASLATYRITEASDRRVTEVGDPRITE